MVLYLLKKMGIPLMIGIAFLSSYSPAVFADSSITIIERDSLEHSINKSGYNSKIEASSTGNQRQRYILTLTDEPVALYHGGKDAFEATSPKGESKLDLQSDASVKYHQYLLAEQQGVLEAIEQKINRLVTPITALQVTSNILVVELSPQEAASLSNIKNISSIKKETLIRPNSVSSSQESSSLPTTSPAVNRHFFSLVSAILIGLFLLYCLYRYRRWRVGFVVGLCGFSALVMARFVPFSSHVASQVGALVVWNGLDGDTPKMGEGVVIGVMDTSVNPKSDSFAEVDEMGYRHTNPRGQYYGVCDPESNIYLKDYPCNDKLIGVWTFDASDFKFSPYDDFGHGSHVSGIAAGNMVSGAELVTPTGYTLTEDIAGIAPHANIIAYRVCGEVCSPSQILQAIDQAILDKVDVLNYSILGFQASPWQDDISQAFLAATNAGIFVAVAGGNFRWSEKNTSAPASSPWVTSVAASSQPDKYVGRLVGLTNDQGDTLAPLEGESLSSAYGPATILDAADYGNSDCVADKFSQAFSGEIILCDNKSGLQRAAQAKNVKANGGGGIILYIAATVEDADGPGYLATDAFDLPFLHILETDAKRLRSWLASGTGHQGEIMATQSVFKAGDPEVIEFFSTHGPVAEGLGMSVIKPNLTAPGHAILAAQHEAATAAEQDYGVHRGTSMSSPVVAGAAALIKSRRPDITPMQIQSALMTTANLNVRKPDGKTPADPFDMGGGRVDVAQAVQAALVLDESFEHFKSADPAAGNNPATLNLAGFGQHSCVVWCSWTRQVTNISASETAWQAINTDHLTMTPETFTLLPGETKEVSMTANISDIALGEWFLDQFNLISADSMAPDAHFPVAARSVISNLPKEVQLKAESETSQVVLDHLKAVEIKQAMVNIFGMTKADVLTGAVVSDPTKGDPLGGDFVPEKDGKTLFRLDVPEQTTRLVVEITESISGDLDLFVGSGTEQPEEKSLLGYSHKQGSAEYVSLIDPPAGPIWIVVQNYEDGHTEPAGFSMQVAMISATDNGSMNVTMPATQPAGEQFDMNITISLPDAKAGDHYYGLVSVGTDPANPDNLGKIGMNWVRK